MVHFIGSKSIHTVIPDFFSQAVAIVAYQMGYQKAIKPIIDPINSSRLVVTQALNKYGIEYVIGKGYYVFINVTNVLHANSFSSTEELAIKLTSQFGLAIVPGEHFSCFGNGWIRFTYAMPPETTRQAIELLVNSLVQLG